MNFWSAIVRIVLILAVLSFAAVGVWDKFVPYGKPVESLKSLDGCYEGEGLPDLIRPPRHWIFIINNGVIVDRKGHDVSKIRLGRRESSLTHVTFSPGILIAGKPADVLLGDTSTGKAFVRRNVVSIALGDETGNLMQKTSCN
jgi:hypothetical protein